MRLVEAGVVSLDGLVADAKSGVSGAGRKAETHILFSEASDNFKAYGVKGHRHGPEINEQLRRIAGVAPGRLEMDACVKKPDGTVEEQSSMRFRIVYEGDGSRTELISATQNGKDVTEKAKAEEAKRLKELETENKRLKKLLAEAELDKAILKEALQGNF